MTQRDTDEQSPLTVPMHAPRSRHAAKNLCFVTYIMATLCSCTKIPLDTPLARLVTVDPAIEMIEHDLVLLHNW
jgi:hypothetical protein